VRRCAQLASASRSNRHSAEVEQEWSSASRSSGSSCGSNEAEAIDFVRFTPATLRPWLEIAYFVATIVMGIASAFVVVQVWLARAALLQAQKDLRVRTTRESIALAAEQCEKFGGDFLRLRKAQTKIAEANGIRVSTWPLWDASFTGNSIATIARQSAEAWAERA
jgi:hypothetical protein